MFWADFNRSMIMMANLDGSQPEVVTDGGLGGTGQYIAVKKYEEWLSIA